MFKKYMHIEKIGHPNTDKTLQGEFYVFPKLDGTNGSLWLENTELKKDNEKVFSFCAGSRNRELALDNDNFDFYNKICNNKDNYVNFFHEHPSVILYGEYLVPRTIKDYNSDAWGKFYIFDCYDTIINEYVEYEIYKEWLNKFKLEYIPAIAKIENPRMDVLLKMLNENTYLMKNGALGEGLVLKNYYWKNKHREQCWIKIVRDDFKYLNAKEFKTKTIHQTSLIEEKIINQYINETSVDKVYNKLCQINSDRRYVISNLLKDVYEDLIIDNIYQIIKENNFPVIDFKLLNKLCIQKIKNIKKEIF